MFFTHAGASDTTITLDAVHLALLAAYDLAYCYIASSPMLVFHAGRFLLKPAEKCRHCCVKIIIIVVFVICIISAMLVVLATLHKIGFNNLGWVAYIPAALIWLFQWGVLWYTIKDSDGIYDFYKDLDKCRGENRVKNGEIVDSYRHLREHGNALSIVLLEIVLGAALTRVSSVANGSPDETKLSLLAVMLAVWIAPGALVWLIGALIELRFGVDSGEPKS